MSKSFHAPPTSHPLRPAQKNTGNKCSGTLGDCGAPSYASANQTSFCH
ncbi:MAG: hypothetical protein U1E91_03585 [Moraxella sp.]